MEKPKCPICGTSAYMVPRSYGEKVGTTIGGVIGLLASVGRGAVIGTGTGALLGSAVPILGTGVGSAVGGFTGALAGFMLGAEIGSKVGSEMDQHILRCFRCNRCRTEIHF